MNPTRPTDACPTLIFVREFSSTFYSAFISYSRTILIMTKQTVVFRLGADIFLGAEVHVRRGCRGVHVAVSDVRHRRSARSHTRRHYAHRLRIRRLLLRRCYVVVQRAHAHRPPCTLTSNTSTEWRFGKSGTCTRLLWPFSILLPKQIKVHPWNLEPKWRISGTQCNAHCDRTADTLNAVYLFCWHAKYWLCVAVLSLSVCFVQLFDVLGLNHKLLPLDTDYGC